MKRDIKRILSMGLMLIMILGCLAGCGEVGKDSPYKNMTSLEFVEVMGNGINLGNTCLRINVNSIECTSIDTIAITKTAIRTSSFANINR